MFEPEAYQKTAEPFLMFCFLKHRKEMAAEKAEENAKNAKKPKRAKKPARSASSSDEDDDDSADDDDEVDEELAKVGQLADELLAHDLLSAIDKGTLTRGELLKAIALKLPSPGANERLKQNKKVKELLKEKMLAVCDKDKVDDDGGDGGGIRGSGSGCGGGWCLDRHEIYECLDLLLMTKGLFSDGTNRLYLNSWSVSRSQLPF